MSRQIIFFLNGKEVDKKEISRRKAKLTGTVITTERYYEAPLTNAEKKANAEQAIANSEYFQRMRDYREDMEKFH